MPSGRSVGSHTRFDTLRHTERYSVGLGIILISEHRSARSFVHEGIGCGLEVAAQIEGTTLQQGHQLGLQEGRVGRILRTNIGERFRLESSAYSACVEFVLYPNEHPALRDLDGELAFVEDAGASDPRFVDLAHCLRAERPSPQLVKQVAMELTSYVERHCVLQRHDPVLRAKRELDRNFAAELYVEHLAELARMHPVTLARKFKARFGTTPVRYRLLSRINHAARLMWCEPKFSTGEVALRAGFNDPAFFHREFLRYIGTTPAHYRGLTTMSPKPDAPAGA